MVVRLGVNRLRCPRRTRLGVKAEHTVDLKTEVILSSVVMHSTQTDQHTLIESVGEAQ